MRWEFTVTLSGEGETIEEAWENAVDAFCEDPGEPNTAILDDSDSEFEEFEEREERSGLPPALMELDWEAQILNGLKGRGK